MAQKMWLSQMNKTECKRTQSGTKMAESWKQTKIVLWMKRIYIKNYVTYNECQTASIIQI